MTPSLAARTRAAARERPVLLEGLAAGAVNYTAAARLLDVEGDEEAVATALRRFADDLDRRVEGRDARVEMRGGVGIDDSGDAAGAPLLAVGDRAVVDGGNRTALLATGPVDAAALAAVLDRLAAAGVGVDAAGVAGEALVVVVGRRAAASALRTVEDALAAVPAVEKRD